MTSINNEPSRTASDRSPAPAPAETETTTSDNEYPPQLHAGAVGYGPDYGKGAGFEDKLQGLKEELKGKMLHKPELIQHGHELRTGEAKKQADSDTNPFNPTGKSAGRDQDKQDEGQRAQSATTAPEGTEKADEQTQKFA